MNTKPGVAGGVVGVLREYAGQHGTPDDFDAAIRTVEAIAALPALWRAEAGATPEMPEWAAAKREDAEVLESAFHGSGPATGGGNASLTEAERDTIETLLNLAYAAWCLADNTEDSGDAGLTIERSDFAALEKHLNTLDSLPDDKPGYTMGEAAKARWALRRLLGGDAATPAGGGDGLPSAECICAIAKHSEYGKRLAAMLRNEVVIGDFREAIVGLTHDLIRRLASVKTETVPRDRQHED